MQILRTLRAGAAGYLLKDTLRKELLDTIRKVHAGRRRIADDIAVADKLGITEETVKTHMRSVLSKLSANDRTHAVTIALKRGYSL